MSKRKFFILPALTFSALLTFGNLAAVCAQETATSEFTLEEITVTAEKRAVNIQSLPSSVVALESSELAELGKATVAQILESVPNVRFESGTAANPNGGIAIRGVKYKQTSDGQPPSATATYVDGVFQGIGGNYDLNRVEVLRGPQGTLYGRSATGGVVSFYTNNPKLSEFGGNVSLEIGTASYKNIQAAVNAPIGEKIAIRLAGHLYERDGYFNPDGGYTQTKEGRIKALYQPTDALEIILSGSLSDQTSNSGGYTARLTSPTTINYKDSLTKVVEGVAIPSTEGSLTINYNFGKSTLTYIGSLRHYVDEDSPAIVAVRPGVQTMYNLRQNFGENFHTEEIRLASDSEGPLQWLIGGNYYNSDYKRNEFSLQHEAYIVDQGVIDTDPNTVDAPIFEQPVSGEITNFGLFTEETYTVRDDFRVTAGLRYDSTEVMAASAFNFNLNVNSHGNSLNPPDWHFFSLKGTSNFHNITYKLRLEYDLTPNNMLYALTATGFQPGDLRLTNKLSFGPDGPSVTFIPMTYDEEKLTSYEIGSKNRFLDNQLQVNASIFYYKYSGFRSTVNIAAGGPPVFAQVATPLEMSGAELNMDWLVTKQDKVTFNAGLLNAKITSYPTIAGLGSTQQYMEFTRLPGTPQLTATLGYDHTFYLLNGSMLMPRLEMHYTSGQYLTNFTAGQLAVSGLKDYGYQDSYMTGNFGTTWTSPEGKYSATVYARNIFDKEYKSAVSIGSTLTSAGVTPGDPRTWGLTFSAKF
jgi:outer membrane receptor protein involved in Fe transport